MDLIHTRGKSFRHEKTKKKRGSYRGGEISTTVSNIQESPSVEPLTQTTAAQTEEATAMEVDLLEAGGMPEVDGMLGTEGTPGESRTSRSIPTVVSWRTSEDETPSVFRTPLKRLSCPSFASPSTPISTKRFLSWRSPYGTPPSPWLTPPSTRSTPVGASSKQEPVIRRTQLVGDSMLMRFAKVVTGQQPTVDAQRCFRIGLCVSGQNLRQLCWRLRQQLADQPGLELSERILMMCGTNDILQGAELERMEKTMFGITRILLNQNCDVNVLTIPPIPKCDKPSDQFKLTSYNNYLTSTLAYQGVKVIDIVPLFVAPNGVIRKELYEEYMGMGQHRRPDLIHWNRYGILLVNKFLTEHGYL